jgi:hypothetical protein
MVWWTGHTKTLLASDQRERTARHMEVNPAVRRGIAERACARPGKSGVRAGRSVGPPFSPLPAANGSWTW